MADIINDGNVRVTWCTSIANTSAPTVAELNAGVALQSYITPDGWNVSTSDDTIDNTALDSVDNTSIAGRRNDDIKVTVKHQGDAAVPWTTFAGRPNGFLVERRGVASSTAWATSQKVRVFPCQAGSRAKEPVAKNELEKFTVQFFKTAAVVDSATVA